MSVLVIVAHPDDESFSMGGTIARLASRGESVTVVTCADGVGSRFRPGHGSRSSRPKPRPCAGGTTAQTLPHR